MRLLCSETFQKLAGLSGPAKKDSGPAPAPGPSSPAPPAKPEEAEAQSTEDDAASKAAKVLAKKFKLDSDEVLIKCKRLYVCALRVVCVLLLFRHRSSVCLSCFSCVALLFTLCCVYVSCCLILPVSLTQCKSVYVVCCVLCSFCAHVCCRLSRTPETHSHVEWQHVSHSALAVFLRQIIRLQGARETRYFGYQRHPIESREGTEYCQEQQSKSQQCQSPVNYATKRFLRYVHSSL